MRIEWENIAKIYANKRWYGRGLFDCEKFILNDISNFIDSVIDVGCGAGRHIRFFKRKMIYTVGLDFSINMIKESKKMCNAIYILGDARKLPFKDSSIDCCVCLGNTIASVGERKGMLLSGAKSAINEMIRVAKKLLVVDFREGVKKYEKRFIKDMPYTTRGWEFSEAIELFQNSKYKEKIRKIKIIKNAKLGMHNFFYIICFLQ